MLYLSSDVWTILETTDGRYNQLSKVDRVADWLCCELGLRNPSELTLATVAALISMYDPAGEQLRQSPEQQLALLQTVRSRFRAMTTRARTAGRTVLLQLSSLPSNTAAIPLAARQARFPDGFVAPRVALQTLLGHARSWPLRQTNALVRQNSVGHSQQSGGDAMAMLSQAAALFRTMGLTRSPRQPEARQPQPEITILRPPAGQSRQVPALSVAASSQTLSLGSSSQLQLESQPSVQGNLAEQASALEAAAPATLPPAIESTPASAPMPEPNAPIPDPEPTATPARPLPAGHGLKQTVEALAAAHYQKALSPKQKMPRPAASTSALTETPRGKKMARPAAAAASVTATDSPKLVSEAAPGATPRSHKMARPAAAAKALAEMPVVGERAKVADTPSREPADVASPWRLFRASAAALTPKDKVRKQCFTPARAESERASPAALKKPSAALPLQTSSSTKLKKRPSASTLPKQASPKPKLKKRGSAASLTGNGKPKKRPSASPGKKGKKSSSPKKRDALKMTQKCIRSRAYHRAKNEAEKAGYSAEEAKEKARLAWRNAC